MSLTTVEENNFSVAKATESVLVIAWHIGMSSLNFAIWALI